MRHIFKSSLVALLALMVTFASVFAGAVHITGSTSYSLGSLKVSGSAVGLQSSGVKWAKIRFVGYGYCYTSTGAYWTPTDPDQIDNDPNMSDDYPEMIQNYVNPTNKFSFALEMPNLPFTDAQSRTFGAGCAPGTWVWTGASLQVWSYLGTSTDPNALLPGTLLDQQNSKCAKNRDAFQCK